jgi:ribonuclease BN (tRNA processing enzyme)
MDFTVVGCSGSFPGRDSAATSYLVRAEGFTLVLDLGNGALGGLQRYISADDIDAVCLSHHHADHCLDMCCLAVARTISPEGARPRIPVYGPARTRDRLDRAASLDPSTTIDGAFSFTTLSPGTLEIGPFRVTTGHTKHPVETFAFRFEHGGRAITYSADSGPCETLVELATGADIALFEASFLEGPDLPADLHLTARQAGQHAARAGAGQLVLTHLVAWNDQDRSVEEATAAFGGPLQVATPGMML